VVLGRKLTNLLILWSTGNSHLAKVEIHFRKILFPTVQLKALLIPLTVQKFKLIINHDHKQKLFADDTKLFSLIPNVEDIGRLRMDLNNLCKWSQDWLILFNVGIAQYCITHVDTGRTEYIHGKAHLS